jgi:hypothetical protein
MSKSVAAPREFIHVKLPVSTKDLLRRMRYETRVPITEILIRVLERAEKEAVLEEWIRTGGPVPMPPSNEEATAP